MGELLKLETVRLQQCVKKVEEQRDRGETCDNGIHGITPSEPVDGLRHTPAGENEESDNENVQNVKHAGNCTSDNIRKA